MDDFETHGMPARAFPTVAGAGAAGMRPQVRKEAAKGSPRALFLSAVVLAATGCTMSEVSSGGEKTADGAVAADWHTCQRPLGTLVVVEENTASLQQQGLSSVEPVIGVLARKTNCFQVARRSKALQEVALREQQFEGAVATVPVAARYALVTTVMFVGKTGEQNWTSLLGGLADAEGAKLFPKWQGMLGQDAESAVEVSEANVVLSLVDNRTGLEVGAAEGAAKARDTRVDGAASALWSQSKGGGTAGAYAKTPQGRLVSAALMDGFNKLVADVEPAMTTY